MHEALLKTIQNPKVQGLMLDTKLVLQSLNLLKALPRTDWDQHKETVASMYKIYQKPMLEMLMPFRDQFSAKTP